MPTILKNHPETIWLPKDTQVVEDSYQFRYGTVNPYSAPMSAATLATTYGMILTPSNYTYARDPEIEYTDFQLLTGENGVTYFPYQGTLAFIKFKVRYPNLKEVYVVFIIRFSPAV
jgi:hypothetical protein